MRIVVDLVTDAHGRPLGTVRIAEQPREGFSDWLDLLRVLEHCVDVEHARRIDAADTSS